MEKDLKTNIEKDVKFAIEQGKMFQTLMDDLFKTPTLDNFRRWNEALDKADKEQMDKSFCYNLDGLCEEDNCRCGNHE